VITTCPHCGQGHLCYPETKVVIRYDPIRKGLVGDVVPRKEKEELAR
jgi:hypothetical protein